MVEIMKSEVIAANIEVHTRMADSYNREEPHFRPENRAKVRAKLERLKSAGGNALLDLGCGTGFIIDLARDLFGEIHGVDVTQAMLDKVDTSRGNISLHNAPAESLPFQDDYFDIITAYAFIHHVEDYIKVLREALRVLKPGGLIYIDLEPNRLYWSAISDLERRSPAGDPGVSAIVAKEIDSVLHTDDRVQKDFGIAEEVFNKAEFTKSILGGIDPWDFPRQCKEVGFSRCDVSFEWFLGQGAVMHGQSFSEAVTVETYLRNVLPLSAHLFKYLQFVLTK
jgi:ubiquinone/menaquinone biosynthesis C-methylase UbiE